MSKKKHNSNTKKQKKTKENLQQQKNASNENSNEKLIKFVNVVIAIAVFFLTNYFIPERKDLIDIPLNKNIFRFLSLVLAAYIFVVLLFKENKFVKQTSKYVLLFLLVLQILITYLYKFEILEEFPNLAVFSEYLIFPTIVTAVMALFLNTEKIKEISPHTLKPNVVLIKQIRQKENLYYYLSFIGILIIAGFVYFYNIDKIEIFEDEYQVYATAEGYFHEGEFKPWDYKNEKINENYYKGAYFHTWMIAKSFDFFGRSLWSARLVSSIWGMLFIVIGFFTFYYFTNSRFAGVLILLVILFFPKYVYFSHYVRMYIVFIPLYLLTAFLVLKALLGKSTFIEKKGLSNSLVGKYFNFAYLPAVIVLGLIYVLWVLHPNTMIILPITFLFVIYLAITRKEKRYYTLLSVSVLVAAITIYVFRKNLSNEIFTFFNSPLAEYNKVYIEYLLNFPTITTFSIALLGIGIYFVVTTNDTLFRDKMVFLYISIITTLVIFIYVFNFEGIAFRYASHITLFAIILILFVFVRVNKVLYNKAIQYLLALSIVGIALSSYYHKHTSLYVKNPLYGYPSVVYGTLMEKYKAGEEVIFGQYFKDIYFRKYEKKYQVIDMLNNKQYTFEQFASDLNKYPKGWTIWMTNKSYHIDDRILEYVFKNFRQYHGHGMDSTLLELYYFDRSMIPGTPEHKNKNKNVFSTNVFLNLNKNFSISFWMFTHDKNAGQPLLLRSDNGDEFIFEPDQNEDGSYVFTNTHRKKNIKTPVLSNQKWRHIVWQFEYKNDKQIVSVYVDNHKAGEITFVENENKTVRLLISNLFNGKIQDVRVYRKILNEEQIKAVYNNGNFTLKAELEADGEKFKPNQHYKNSAK